MAVTLHASGTQTAVISTEHELATAAVVGVFSIHVDVSNMASGDTTELRIYQKILTGGTAKVAYYQSFSDAQGTDNAIAISVPIANDLVESNALKFTLKQTSGTGRQYSWKVLKY